MQKSLIISLILLFNFGLVRGTDQESSKNLIIQQKPAPTVWQKLEKHEGLMLFRVELDKSGCIWSFHTGVFKKVFKEVGMNQTVRIAYLNTRNRDFRLGTHSPVFSKKEIRTDTGQTYLGPQPEPPDYPTLRSIMRINRCKKRQNAGLKQPLSPLKGDAYILFRNAQGIIKAKIKLKTPLFHFGKKFSSS